MGKAAGFELVKGPDGRPTGDIRMNAGDTGSMKVSAQLESGDDWTEYSRMLFTVTDSQDQIVMQRIYRLDDQWGLGNGFVLIEFHNDDTDEWPSGTYTMERRYNETPVWEGTPSDARCVNALTSSARMVEGNGTVRTVFRGTLTIESVSGRI